MDDSRQTWDQMIAGLRAGDPDICTSFWNQYGPLLEAVAKRQLSDRLQRRLGPEDVVQSACRTFFRRMSEEQFQLSDTDDLWRLMCAITLNKARRAARDQSRKKRGMQQEQYLDQRRASDSGPSWEMAGRESSPLEVAEVSDQLSSLLAELNADECEVLDLKLQHFNNDEIAEKLGCSERTVRRMTKRIQARWQGLMTDEMDE